MKKLVFGLIATGLISISSVNASIETTNSNKFTSRVTKSFTGEYVAKTATSSISARALTDSMEDFMLYKATIIFPRVASKNLKETRTAKNFAIVSYSDIISSTYTVDGVVYNDNGSVNDLIAGDEIYTSDELYTADTIEFDYKHLKYIASPDFKSHKEIQEDFANGNLERRAPPKGLGSFLLGLAVDLVTSCHYSYTTQGNSLLGVSCSSGCLQINCIR